MSALETMMPAVQRVATNGVELAYHEVGKGQGVPVVFCHGFPELAFSWRHQLKAFEDAGRWAIAPDQRGYGLSSKPAAVTDYDLANLAGDMIGMLDALGIQKAIFCGHDWGGIVTWQLPLMYPDRIAGVIGLNTPLMPRSPVDPIAAMRAAFGPDMYIVWFQTPGDADAVLGQNVEKTMRFFMRKPATSGITTAAERNAGGSTFAFKDLLNAWDASDTAGQMLSAAELAAFVQAFEAGGFTGPINWYRNFTRNWVAAESLPSRIDDIPCLMITAELDAVLRPDMAAHMAGFINDLETHMVKGSGHWTQQEKPEEVNALILGWLDRRFPT